MATPRLNPPCQGWQRDLPGPNEPLAEAPTLLWLAATHLDSVYMELPRSSLNMRGFVLLLATMMALFALFYPAFSIWLDIVSGASRREFTDIVTGVLLDLAATAFCVWSALVLYRADTSPPRDLPLRFNRLRRTVYVYGFQSVWWNPFTRWYVTTASYNWDDLRAEKWKVRAASSSGGLIIKEGVSIAVVKPGTNDVIERFDLSTRAANTSNVWAYACHYMQHGQEGLDPREAEPRDANDVAPYNLALRLAPKVQWPAAMDIESRTAP